MRSQPRSSAALMFGILVLFVFVFCGVPAHADTIMYTDSGTFSTTTASSGFTGPGETWAFSFQADSNPTVFDFGMGGFNFTFSDFSYLLNGLPVAITPTFIRFFSPTNGGGFAICFNGTTAATCADGLGTTGFGPAMYQGSTSAPTLIPGQFTFTGPFNFAFVVNSNLYFQADTTVQATNVPEPSTLIMLVMGFLALVSLVSFAPRLRARHA